MFGHHSGEMGVFRKKSDSGMNGVGVGDGGRRQDGRNIEITSPRRGGADADAFVGQAHMHGVGVGGGMDGYGTDAHFPAGAVNAQSDFTAVGDEDFFKHP